MLERKIMTKTQYYTATSIDGFIADANNSLDWLMEFGDEPAKGYTDFISQVGAIAMGSTTYEWVLENGIFKDPDNPEPWPYEQPSWIFSSRTLPKLEGCDLRFVNGDVKPVHADMAEAAKGKNIWLVGGGELVGQFFDQGLLDEIILGVAPVTLGSGKPLLPRRITKPSLTLVSVKSIDCSFMEVRYLVNKDNCLATPEDKSLQKS